MHLAVVSGKLAFALHEASRSQRRDVKLLSPPTAEEPAALEARLPSFSVALAIYSFREALREDGMVHRRA
ncbi:MAG: hypothetical protein EOM24_37245 [Chloroflexia bacterium]|nr:hypothetical protein [Chloroflexia bacterium]